MALNSILLRCLAKSAIKHVTNLLTFGVGGDLLTDFWDAWRQAQDEDRRRAEIERLASASPTDVRATAAQIIREEGAALPAEQQRQLAAWLTQTPAAIRRSLRRPADPSGKTVAPGQAPTCARDLAALVPARPPRFKPGDRPMPGVDLVVEELLGVGGFGEVWKARNPNLASAPPVALKFCIDAQARQTLRHESAMLDAVMRHGKHPGIVELQRTYLEAEPPCLEYQYVEGGDLADLIRAWHRKGQATPERVAQLMLRLASIVAFAHQQGIVHRDLKPANVLVEKGPDGKVKLRVTDFGIGAVASRQAADQARRETRGTASLATVARGAYTPQYASPQQVRGEKADPHDDVYALGVIWYQALTGEMGEGAPTGEAWKDDLRQKGMSEELLGLLVSCVEARAEHRPGSAQELEERLRSAVEKEPVPDVELEQAGNPNRARLGLIAFGGVLLFFAMVAGVVWLLNRPASPGTGSGASAASAGQNTSGDASVKKRGDSSPARPQGQSNSPGKLPAEFTASAAEYDSFTKGNWLPVLNPDQLNNDGEIEVDNRKLTFSDSSGTDMILRAKFKRVTAKITYLLLRQQGQSMQSYNAHLMPQGRFNGEGPFFALFHSSGIHSDLSTAIVEGDYSRFHEAALCARGNTICLFIDGKKVTQATDQSYSSGLPGIGAIDGKAKFKDVEVQFLRK